jgi:alanine dehydrogenase
MISRMLVLSRAEVRELLDLDALIDALAPAMADLSAGRA